MKLAKVMTLVLGAGLLMGNQQCQQTPTETKARELKKTIGVSLISSRPIEIPGNGSFDFQFVLNQQIYPVLQEDSHFVFNYEPIFNQETFPQVQNKLDLTKMNLSEGDYQFLEKNLQYNPPKIVFSDEVSCFVNQPQLVFYGSVNSFEMVSKIGLNLGFVNNVSSTSNGIPHLGFDTETFQLDLNMYANEALVEKLNIASVNVTSKQTKTQVSFFVPFQSLLFEPSFFFQTPLSKVSYSALKKAVQGIYDQITAKEKADEFGGWNSRVLFDHEHEITILAGKSHNVKIGDRFDIYNQKTYWKDDNGAVPVPCVSKLSGVMNGPVVATIEIIDVSEGMSIGKVIYETKEPRKMGALVKINKLVADTTTTADPNKGGSSNTKSF